MYLEDYFIKLRDIIIFSKPSELKLFSEWHLSFINNVSGYIGKHDYKGLSTEQAKIVIKLLLKFQNLLIASGVSSVDLNKAIQYSKFKKPLYQSADILREVRYIGENKLAFRFKMNQTIKTDIKKLVEPQFPELSPKFNMKYKIWIVTVTSNNAERVMRLIVENKFSWDKETNNFMDMILENKSNISTVAIDNQENKIYFNLLNNPLLFSFVKLSLSGKII